MEIKELDKDKILEAFSEAEGQGLDEINYQLREIAVDKETNILLETLEDMHYFLRDTREVAFFSKYNERIEEIYSELKADLFDKLEITKVDQIRDKVIEKELYYNNKILVKHKEFCSGKYKIIFRTYIVIQDGIITVEKYENKKLLETYNLANVKKNRGY